MSTDVHKATTGDASLTFPSDLARIFALQCGFVIAVTLLAFAVTLGIIVPIVHVYRPLASSLPDSTINSFIVKLAANGQLSDSLSGLLKNIVASATMRDLAHFFGVIGEAAAIVLSLLIPQRLLKYGTLGVAVLAPLTFVMLVLVSSVAQNPWWFCPPYGYFSTFTGAQAQFLAFSAFLFVARAKFTKFKLTSRADAAVFWILLIILFTATTYFSMTTGTFCRID